MTLVVTSRRVPLPLTTNRLKQPKNGALHLVAELDELARRRHDKRCGRMDPGLRASSHFRGLVAHEIDQGGQRQIILARPLDQRATGEAPYGAVERYEANANSGCARISASGMQLRYGPACSKWISTNSDLTSVPTRRPRWQGQPHHHFTAGVWWFLTRPQGSTGIPEISRADRFAS